MIVIMKRLILIAFIALSSICFAQTKSILFIGNSYTYYNGGVDVMLKNIALAEGDTLYTESLTVGGATFSSFCNNSETFSRIRSRAWDYVVLQEQSQLPSFPPSQVEAECYPYAKRLCDSIRANDSCTQILFFMTWGRENGDQSNCNAYPPLCTYDGMQQRLRESYVQMADDNNAIVVPVGLAWKYVRDNYPEINLYQSDESHPSVEGTYLAALTFRSILFQGKAWYDNLNLDCRPENIDWNVANLLHYAVQNAVYSNWSECNMDESLYVYFDVWIPTKTIGADYVQVYTPANIDSCVLTSSNGISYTFLPNDLDTWMGYAHLTISVRDFLEYSNDTANICVTIYRNNCSFSRCEDFYYCVLGGINNVQSENFSFTNPVTNGKLQFDSDLVGNYEIYSIDGRLIASGFVSGCEIDVSLLKQGMYLLRINGVGYKFVVE